MNRTKARISYNMSRIRSKGTRIEKIVSSCLRKEKISYRSHARILGKPDFTIPSKKIVLFCDSSFWHGYKGMTTKRHRFKSNKKFWVKKIAKNMERDKKVNKYLRKQGWKVLRFWDFQIEGDIAKCIKRIKKALR